MIRTNFDRSGRLVCVTWCCHSSMKAIKSQLKPMDPGMLECLGPRSNQCVLYRCSAANLSAVRDCGSFITDLLVTPLPVGEQSIAMSVSVCLSVCPFSIAYRYLRNHVPKRHHIIGSSLATSAGAMCFRFCGWRHVCSWLARQKRRKYGADAKWYKGSL